MGVPIEIARRRCLGWALLLLAIAGCGSASQGADAAMDAVESCVPPSLPAPTIGRGQLCTDDSECLHQAGERGICAPATDDEVVLKIQRCHVLGPGRSGEPCEATLSSNGHLQSPGSAIVFVPIDAFALSTSFCPASDGLACSRSTQTCQPAAALGSPCTDVQCVEGLLCKAGTCVARLQLGEHCQDISDFTDEPWCDDTGYCDMVSQTCVPRLSDGALCYPDRACLSNICLKNSCAPAGTCRWSATD